jgi:hypothetical protein
LLLISINDFDWFLVSKLIVFVAMGGYLIDHMSLYDEWFAVNQADTGSSKFIWYTDLAVVSNKTCAHIYKYNLSVLLRNFLLESSLVYSVC